ncbi:hypothetical protein IC006_0996 [Sulfuracidifex tepidarius]|uniref:Uncharacterized protein n=1 Tax=Sulfuracidifex tepidarius TaxID=1294262 RepID=A0A510DTZ8_9CREN|nr:hypothetical protein IC006_0996 [Sulfuracidifex tepidarius]BBG26458.1 hypothetical protein IC007_0968 [Sulfuracidifex tepidarius]
MFDMLNIILKVVLALFDVLQRAESLAPSRGWKFKYFFFVNSLNGQGVKRSELPFL